MAAKRKTTASKTSNSSKKSTEKRQLISVILFALSVFLLFVVFVKGENLWTYMHDFMFGMFGCMAFLCPFILGFFATYYASESFKNNWGGKVIIGTVLVGLIDVCIDIFSTAENEKLSYIKHIANAYGAKKGGVIGAIIGNPLCRAFGKFPAEITVIILICVFLMIITGTTLATLFKTVAKPVKVVSDKAENAYKERVAKNGDGEKLKKGDIKIIKGFDVNIPIDEEKKETEKPKYYDPKQRKVIDTYNAEDTSSATIDDALDNVEYEVIEPPAETEEEKVPEKIKVDFEKETAAVADEIERHGGVQKYNFPPTDLLDKVKVVDQKAMSRELDNTAERLVEILKSFGVETRVLDISKGPTVTRYELQPCAGVKISKITNLADDIALNLAAAGVRIEAPIPNKAAVGIEVPNKASATVGVREIIESPVFTSSRSKLTVSMGRDIGGNVVITDIAKMPHGLIAGATGSGKSVCINSIIVSLLYKASPEDVKLLMIDPKVVELGEYNGIPHLLVPVVTDPKKAAGALGWAVTEMEKRYAMFADRGVRDIEGYNRFVATLKDEPEVEKMPHIVIIIDELADLMMTAPSEVEDSINRIAAKARAAGMHLLIATQRPSVDVVTGVIKANIPTRIAFAVSSQIDSRTILDSSGAEKLLGKGDMLFSPIGSTKPKRLQGCFVSDSEVERVVEFIKKSASANYDDDIMVEIERQAALEKQKKSGLPEDGPDADPLLEEAIKVVVENGQASTSLLQRKLKLGYARAARIVDEMEARGVVGPYEGSKPRKVLLTKEQLMERQATEQSDDE